MVNVCTGCDFHMFFAEYIIEAVSFLAKGGQKWKISEYLN